MDVKNVPSACYAGSDGEKFYQYTMLEEASRKRFLYAYKENSSDSTIDFVQRAILCFGYAPEMIQTDHGREFTHAQKTDRMHPLDILCRNLHIAHKVLRPRTPWHNGKVERSHRSDQERFYNLLRFYSYEDLQIQMKRYLRRANNIPMAVVGIVMKFFQIVISIVVGMAAGCIPIVGYNMGAEKKLRVRELFTKLLVAEALVGAVALILAEGFPRQLIAIFGADNESSYYTDFAIKAFRTYLCMMILACINKACFIFQQAVG